MPFNKYKKIIDDLSTLDFDLSIILTGGEPLFVDNICEYGKYARKYAKKVSLGSNGSFIPTLKQEKLDDIKNTFDQIYLSFDSTNPKLFEKLANHSIEPVLKAIDILNKNEIKIKLTPVVTKYNVEFDSIIKFCEDKGIKKLRFFWFIPREATDHSLSPSEKDYEYMMERFNNYKGDIDVKIDRYYNPPFSALIISPSGKIVILSDLERKNTETIGTYDNFIDNLKAKLEQHNS